MKKILMTLALAATATFTFVSCNSSTETTEGTEEAVAIADGTVTIDAAASSVMWKGEMLGLYSHEGTVPLKSGSITITDGAISAGNFEIDLTTINPTDDAYGEDNPKEKLVGHLSSADFFNVEQFPTATFEITGSEGTSVMGNLTVRGITNPEKVENVVITQNENGTSMTGDLTFDRTKYDVNFSMPVEDKVLSNDIKISVSLAAAK
ncbi:Polyisoprenoid-binding protein YceI [Spirosomataceae bacterium TFI 002]|nr:Polyisoprenoid-binding protein YceI [Spirosomataceae bacterium TFI 002]